MSFLKLTDEVTSPSIQTVVGDFLSNVIRTYNLAQFLPRIVELAALDQHFHNQAIHKATGKVVGDFEITESERVAAHLQYQKLLAANNAAVGQNPQFTDMLLWAGGVRRLNELMTTEGQRKDWIAQNVESLLASVAISLWTAVETCLTDLWVMALNDGPKSLKKKVAKGAKLDPASEGSTQQAKQMPIESLVDYGFDLRKRMGDLFRDLKKVDFQSISSTAKAYNVAFGDSVKAIFDETNQPFANIIVLSEVRNLYVHRGGLVDERFRRSIKRAPGTSWLEMANFPEKQLLAVNGGFIKGAAQSVVQFCRALILFVDKSMTPKKGWIMSSSSLQDHGQLLEVQCEHCKRGNGTDQH
jgi:hypothetical protein